MGEKDPTDKVSMTQKMTSVASSIEDLQTLVDDLTTSLKERVVAWEEMLVTKMAQLEADLSLLAEAREIALKD